MQILLNNRDVFHIISFLNCRTHLSWISSFFASYFEYIGVVFVLWCLCSQWIYVLLKGGDIYQRCIQTHKSKIKLQRHISYKKNKRQTNNSTNIKYRNNKYCATWTPSKTEEISVASEVYPVPHVSFVVLRTMFVNQMCKIIIYVCNHSGFYLSNLVTNERYWVNTIILLSTVMRKNKELKIISLTFESDRNISEQTRKDNRYRK